MARLEFPSQLSSQNLTFLPSPIFHLKPSLAALAAHINPLKIWEAPASLLLKMFGLQVLYLKSRRVFQSLLSVQLYLFSQDPNRQMFSSLKFGIPSPPNSFGMLILSQLAKWYL